MDKRNEFEATEVTNDELDKTEGSHLRYNIGDCFMKNNHYYLQRENDVLHIYTQLINTLHNCSLDDGIFEKISREKFDMKINTTIFEMGIYKYVKEKI